MLISTAIEKRTHVWLASSISGKGALDTGQLFNEVLMTEVRNLESRVQVQLVHLPKRCVFTVHRSPHVCLLLNTQPRALLHNASIFLYTAQLISQMLLIQIIIKSLPNYLATVVEQPAQTT